jgi:hypothetical protein
MKNEAVIENLTKEIQELKTTIEELTVQVQKLQLNSKAKVPGSFKVGDKVVLLTGGQVGKYGDKAVVTKVGRRISVVVNGRHTNRVPTNLKHDQ